MKLGFHVFLLFDVRKHMASSFYLKWTKFTRNCKFCSNCGYPGTRTKLEQIHNFLWIWSILGKMIKCFLALRWRNTWNVAKNIVLRSPGTHFMHMRVKAQCVCKRKRGTQFIIKLPVFKKEKCSYLYNDFISI